MSISKLKIPFENEYILQRDTVSKTTFTFSDEDIDLTTSQISMVIKDGDNKIINVSEGNGITVISSKIFEIDEIPKENNNLPIGSFEGDLKIIDSNGVRFTYMRVEYTIIEKFD